MDLTTLYAKYTEYIRADQFPDSSRTNRFAQGLWGNPITFGEFREQWQRICRNPALRELWEQRLEAGYEARMAEIRELTARLIACCVSDRDVHHEIERAVPA